MKIVGIVVLFNDSDITTKHNIINISNQVDCLYAIDNSSDSNDGFYGGIDKVYYIPQYKNLGIAAAQNIGIKKAIDDGAEFIFFADPDTEFPKDTISRLLLKYQKIKRVNSQAGGICTSAINETTGYPISLKGNFIKEERQWKATEITYMMNSGSLIPTELFRIVGNMWEELFIDDVDCEWCWRATRKANVRFYQDNEVSVKHHLGNQAQKVGGKLRSISSPQRLFYQFRNYLWMLKTGYAPKQWLMFNGWKYAIKAFYFPLFVKPRWTNLKKIVCGVFAGIAQKKNKPESFEI